MFTRPPSEIIRTRASWRTYRPDPIPGPVRARLEDALASPPPTPFGATPGVFLVDAPDLQERGVKLGTYGVIQGAVSYLVGTLGAPARSPEARAWQDFGFAFEWALLVATDLDLQTCWLGGTLSRDAFGAAVKAGPDDLIPAASPVGLARERRSLTDRTMRFFAKSTERKPWEDLFFDGAFGTPLAREAAGPWAAVLDAVRQAPSASNRQPWRLLRDGDRFHLYVARTPSYRKMTSVDLQRMDMGIAMCHFQLVARELGLAGAWTWQDRGETLPPLTEYAGTWGA